VVVCIVGALLSSTAGTLLHGAGISKSTFVAKEDLKDLNARQQTRSFSTPNNLIRIFYVEKSKY
jgi:hypothetical protein